MLINGIILLVLALGCAGNGLSQFFVHQEYCTLYITDPLMRIVSNPGFAWFCAAAIVLILSLVLIISALKLKKRARAESKLPYFITELSLMFFGLGALAYGLMRNAVITTENTVKLAADSAAATVPYQGTLWIVVGAIAAAFGLCFFLIQTVKQCSASFAAKVESGKIYGFFRDYKSEMKKIVWSPKKDVARNTTMVVVILLVVGILVGLLDFGFTNLILLIGGIGVGA